MTHALATHTGESNLHTAAITNHTLVFNTLVFTARALPVTSWTKDTLTEETALFGFEGAVIDGLGIFDLSLAPAAHGIGRCHRDGHLIKTNGLRFTNGFVKV